MARFHHLVTGLPKDADALLHTGARLQTLEHLFNLLHAGFDRRQARPPEKLVRLPVVEGPFQGERLDPDRWEAMLDEYYRLHGYDPASGRPTRERLEALGLQEAGRRLALEGIHLPRAGAPEGQEGGACP
jgi:aldehyde:ferredoxin oxidoreductase